MIRTWRMYCLGVKMSKFTFLTRKWVFNVNTINFKISPNYDIQV